LKVVKHAILKVRISAVSKKEKKKIAFINSYKILS
jgi:hypothetical protein